MASSYYGNGYAPMQVSSLIRQKTQNDPNWELNPVSDEQTSVFTEKGPSRTLTAVGFLDSRTLSLTDLDAQGGPAANWLIDTNNGDQKSTGKVNARFYFNDVDIQRCYGLKVENIVLSAIPEDGAVFIRPRELCADTVNDNLVLSARRYNFNSDPSVGTVIQFRNLNYKNVNAPPGVKLHTIRLFAADGSENGFYSPVELLEAVVAKIKAYFESYYAPNLFNIHFFVDSASGKLVIAWKPDPAIEAVIGGGFDVNISSSVSTVFKLLNRFLIIDRFRRGVYNYDTVVNGDGISFVLKRGGVDDLDRGGQGVSNLANAHPLMIAISPELTQFEKDDSITPVAATGEIATFYPTIQTDQDVHLYASTRDGTLFSPKLPFDPNFSLNSFTVELVFAANSKLFESLLSDQDLNFDPQNITSEEVKRRIHLIVTATLF